MIDLSPYHFTNSPFKDLPEEQVQFLIEASKEKKYNRGEAIYRVNEFPKGIFIIRKGRVKIYNNVSSGENQIMNIHVAGEIIGYRPLLCSERYPVTAAATEPCALLFVPAKVFSALLNRSPEFSNLLLRYLSHEFTVWVNTISILTHKTVKERLLLNLLILSAKYQERSVWPIKIGLSKSDIANLIGTSNETLARVLQTLKKDNLIAAKGRAIQINAQQLKRLEAEVKLFL